MYSNLNRMYWWSTEPLIWFSWSFVVLILITFSDLKFLLSLRASWSWKKFKKIIYLFYHNIKLTIVTNCYKTTILLICVFPSPCRDSLVETVCWIFRGKCYNVMTISVSYRPLTKKINKAVLNWLDGWRSVYLVT